MDINRTVLACGGGEKPIEQPRARRTRETLFEPAGNSRRSGGASAFAWSGSAYLHVPFPPTGTDARPRFGTCTAGAPKLGAASCPRYPVPSTQGDAIEGRPGRCSAACCPCWHIDAVVRSLRTERRRLSPSSQRTRPGL